MSWLGDFAGNLLGSVVGGAASGAVSNAYNMQAMDKQHEYNKDMYQHRYQWQVDDMRKAGLNPMLSALNQSAGSPTGTGILSANTGSSLSADVNSSRRISEIEKNQLANNTRQTDSTISLNRDLSLKYLKEGMYSSAAADKAQKEADYTTLLSAWYPKLMENNMSNATKVADAQASNYISQGAAAMQNAATNAAGMYNLSEHYGHQNKYYDSQTTNWDLRNKRETAKTSHYGLPGTDFSAWAGEVLRNLNPLSGMFGNK